MGDLFILQVLAFSQETILKFSVFKEHPIFPIRVEYFQNPGSIFFGSSPTLGTLYSFIGVFPHDRSC
jgi:hypothetical protein